MTSSWSTASSPRRCESSDSNHVYLAPRQGVKTSARDCEIRGGEYVAYDRANYATALKVWLPLAEQGDAAAQTYVGEIFEKGLGVPPDYDAAATWYRRAAESGYSRAAINLGNLYEQGLGVPKDPTQALNWYRRAAGLSELTFDIVPGKTAAELQDLRAQIAGPARPAPGQAGCSSTRRRVRWSRCGEESRSWSGMRQGARQAQAARLRRPRAPPRRVSQGQHQRRPAMEAARSVRETRPLSARRRRRSPSSASRSTAWRHGPGSSGRWRISVRSSTRRRRTWCRSRPGFQPRTSKHETPQGGPRIKFKQVQLVEPEVIVSTRDVQANADRGPGRRREAGSWWAVWRAHAGLKSLAINRAPASAREGTTLFTVHLTEADRHLRIVATDRRERTSTLEFLLPTGAAKTGGHAARGASARLTPSQRLAAQTFARPLPRARHRQQQLPAATAAEDRSE